MTGDTDGHTEGDRAVTAPAGPGEERRRSEWPGILLRLLVAAVVLVGGYVGVAYYLGGRVPNGTTVQGVGIGTLTPQDAREVLQERLAPLTTDPVTVHAAGEDLRLDPAEAGLALDLRATLDDVTGVSFDPRVLWARATDRGEVLPLRASVDRERLEGAVAGLSGEVDAEPREGQVKLSSGAVQVVRPEPGRRLDVTATADAVQRAWPEDREVDAVVPEVPPELAASEIERFVAEDAEPALDGPLVITVGEEETTVTPNQLSRLLSVQRSAEDRLHLELDDTGLVELVRGAVTEAESAPRDATVRLEEGRPRVLPAEEGRIVDDEALVGRTRAAVTGEGPRKFEVPLATVQPEVTTAQAQDWDVDQVMAEFTSVFPTGPSNAARTENIRVGLSHLDGVVVMPGEQFSLGEHLAPITAERGYVPAGVIDAGRLVKGMGGGLSQVSTVVLNTAWFAGVQLDEFTPHSYYISRYPAGREATIALPSIDNRWTNDTDSPIVVQTWITGDTIVMRFWGERQYQVDTVTGERRNVVQPERRTDDSADCLDQSPQEGFDITVTRVLHEGGEQVDRQSWTTRYQPSPEVVCTSPAAGR